MKNGILITVVIILTIGAACSSEDNKGFLWEKENGDGSAYTSLYTSDSLYLFAGSSSGRAAAVKTTVSGRQIYRHDGDAPGRYTSVTEDTSGIYLAGASNGKIVVTRISNRFTHHWTYTYDTSTGVESAKILKLNDDKYIVVGGDRSDSLRYNKFVILIINREGEAAFLSESGGGNRQTVSDVVVVNQDDLVTAVTRRIGNGKSQAVIARYSTAGDLLWERELYNNPEFGSSASSLAKGEDGTIYITGLIEMSDGDNLLTSSWVAGFTPVGNQLWKRHLENSNAGMDLFIKDGTDLMVLNRNCGIINHISLPDGSVTDRSALYYACDPSDSEFEIRSLNVLPCGDYLVTGSRSGKFYYSRYTVTGAVN